MVASYFGDLTALRRPPPESRGRRLERKVQYRIVRTHLRLETFQPSAALEIHAAGPRGPGGDLLARHPEVAPGSTNHRGRDRSSHNVINLLILDLIRARA